MTLNGRNAFYSTKDASFGAHYKKIQKIDPYYQRQKCRPFTLVSGDIKFVRIFAGVLYRGGVKRQWGNRKRRFSWLSDATSSAIGTLGNETNIIIQYYLDPCRLSSDPKNMTLNDLDGLFGVKFCFLAGLAGSTRRDFGK